MVNGIAAAAPQPPPGRSECSRERHDLPRSERGGEIERDDVTREIVTDLSIAVGVG